MCMIAFCSQVLGQVRVHCKLEPDAGAGRVPGSSHCVSDAHRTHEARVRVTMKRMIKRVTMKRVMMQMKRMMMKRRMNLFDTTVAITTTIPNHVISQVQILCASMFRK